MAETDLADALLNAMKGTEDAEQEVYFPDYTSDNPWYTAFYRMLYRLLAVARRAGDLRVYKDGALTCGVRPGKFFNGDTVVNYAGATAQALTNNDTNYIYLEADGTLVINITGFPVPSVTPHIPLATIVMASGDYDGRDVADSGAIDHTYRARAMYQVCGGGQSLNLLDWQESLLDEVDFTTSEPGSPSLGDRYLNTATGTSSGTSQSVTANHIYEWNGTNWTDVTPTEGACCVVEDRDMLIAYNGSAWVDIGTFALLNEAQTFFGATDISGSEAETLTDGSSADSLHVHGVSGLEAAVQDLLPNVLLTGADDGDGTGSCTIQVRDAANNNLAQRFLVRTWIADAEYSEPDPQTGFTVTTGELMRQIEAHADHEVISDASGQVVMDINAGGAKTVYVMAEVDGRIYSSGAINITT